MAVTPGFVNVQRVSDHSATEGNTVDLRRAGLSILKVVGVVMRCIAAIPALS
jgi:hypothetical protein